MARRMVLVGGGHAHALVLAAWARRPLPGVQGVVVVDRRTATYSGLAPAVLAGEVPRDVLQIDIAGLAEAAGFRLVEDALDRVDAGGKRLILRSGRGIRYDVASLDVGSVVAGSELEGVVEHTVATRPLHRLLDAVEQTEDVPRRVVVVGGGAGGVEVACALRARWKEAGHDVHITLVTGDELPLAGRSRRVREALRDALVGLGIHLQTGSRAMEAAAGDVCLEDGHILPSDRTFWVAGAAAPDALEGGDLPRDARGFVRVGPTLEVVGCRDLFAAGDCAVHEAAPWVTRAGVYAVRQAPVLDHNLRAALGHGTPRPWTAQRHTLALLDLGDGTVFATKWGLWMRGRLMRWLKRAIDRRFVSRLARVVAKAVR